VFERLVPIARMMNERPLAEQARTNRVSTQRPLQLAGSATAVEGLRVAVVTLLTFEALDEAVATARLQAASKTAPTVAAPAPGVIALLAVLRMHHAVATAGSVHAAGSAHAVVPSVYPIITLFAPAHDAVSAQGFTFAQPQ
jgi:hypothetical protein